MEPIDEKLPPDALSKIERLDLAAGFFPDEMQGSAAEICGGY